MLFAIVFVIVLQSVVNTIGMSVIERTRETGTLRALGLKRRGVRILFGAEAGALALFGCVIGMLLTFAV
ncbi:MAG: FtsX-like permease family protein, partial [Planctomycetes bacterium]|nr:FtsX-like permease family protein [Planctomycetota bacterium]